MANNTFNPQSSLSNTPQNFSQGTLTLSQEQSLITYNHLTYALYALSFFTAGLTWIIPLIMNYVKRDEARGTWLYSHFDWQLKTFWYSIFVVAVGWTLVGFGTGGLIFGMAINHGGTMAGSVMMTLIGGLLLGLSYCWHLYRLIRGWIALANHRAVG